MSLPCFKASVYLWLPSGGKFQLLSMGQAEVLYSLTTPVIPLECHECPSSAHVPSLLGPSPISSRPSSSSLKPSQPSQGDGWFLHPPKLQQIMLCCNCEVTALPFTKFWGPPGQGSDGLLPILHPKPSAWCLGHSRGAETCNRMTQWLIL